MMSSFTLTITEEIHNYLVQNALPESSTAKALREDTQKNVPMAVMQISQEQGAFMALLVQIIGARRTIEIGTFTGYSALVVAEALPSDGKVVTCDINEPWTQVARKYWQLGGVDEKIELHLRPAVETLETLLEDGKALTFDFAFIDADKSGYMNYYENCLKLLRPGGVVAIDNVLWGGRTANTRISDPDTVAIRELNRFITSDDRVASTMLPIGDGLTLAWKR